MEQKVDFDKCTLELRKADKYYISFRILNRWGFYFQGLNCLLFSLETFLKLFYLLGKDFYTNSELRKIGHTLEKVFNNNLNKTKFDIIFNTISNYGYTEIRYDSPDLVNELNGINKKGKYVYLDRLHKEIEELHKIITDKIRKKFNTPNYVNGLDIYKYHSMDSEDKKKLIDDCLSRGDPNLSFDNC